MLAAGEHRISPIAGGILSDSNDHAGFSFQISETPPPARQNPGTPLADLELEMGDFGDALQSSPLPPEPARPALSAWLDEPIRPAPPASPVPQAKQPKAAGNPPTKTAEAPEPEPPPVSAPKIHVPSEPAQRRAEAKAPAQATSLRQASPEPTVPRIKKISFPVSPSAKSSAKPPPEQPPAEEEKPARARTRFSKSIGAEQPRPHLDSEPELNNESPASEPKMAPPEDLPNTDEPLLPPQADSDAWGTDTPSAREIWKRARGSWHAASKQAVALSGQSLRAGKALAQSVNGKMKERLREAAEQRAAEAQRKSERPVSTAPVDDDLAASRPSMAGKMILGLARSAGRTVAAPASALAAAAIVYFAGSHLLGADGSVALSKAVKGPEIPELGTLEGAENTNEPDPDSEAQGKNSEQKPPKSEKASSGGPPPMQTEVTDMPQGMSWPGKGLIEVVTSQDELVYVDGVFTGRGPLRRIPVSPGEHEVSIRADGKERQGSVKVQANKNTRAVFKGE